MLIKITKSYRDIVALCDKELIGKTFEEKNFQLYVKESFYKDKEIGEVEAIEILREMVAEDATFNIVGEKSIKTALKAKIIDKNAIGRIAGIPFALILA
jgi:uncharacterized protein